MDFGLGLILSFTDNASAGIQNAVNSLGQLTSTAESVNRSFSTLAVSQLATQMGDGFTRAGGKILSTLGQITKKVTDTGQTINNAVYAFDTLYAGSGKTGKQVVSQIQNYAAKSIFAFEDLIPVVQMLKANGVEAFDDITTSSGKTTQKLMDYASDLAAFNPQMRNAYGTGVQAAMGAINEYIAEGNKKSLKSGASIDIEQILGEKKGSTIQEREVQVADLLEKLHMVGQTAHMAGTPMQILSNLEDQVFITLGKIADSGVYDMFSKILTNVANAVSKLNLDKIATSIGKGITAILKPIEKLSSHLGDLADKFNAFVDNNPELAKFVIIGSAVGGVLLVLSGLALKAMGAIGNLAFMVKNFAGAFGSLGGALKTGAVKIVGALVPITLALGLMAVVWKSDLFGIRSNVTQFVSGVVNSFKTARNAVNGSLTDIQGILSQYNRTHSFFDGLTLGIARVMTLMKALSEGWDDFTLSEDTFNKAKELGLLPLIEAIFNLKYRFDNFKKGFIQGWKDISANVVGVIDGLKAKVKGTIFDTLLDKITKFFQKLSDNDADAWYQFGYSFAGFTAKAIAFGIALKIIKTTVSGISKLVSGLITVGSTIGKFFGGVGKVFGGIGTGIAKVFSFIARSISDVQGFFALVQENGLVTTLRGLFPVFDKIFSFFDNVTIAFWGLKNGLLSLHDVFMSIFGPVGTALAGVGSIVTGLIMSVKSFVDQWKNGASVIKGVIQVIGGALVGLGLVILGIAGWPAIIVGAVVAAVAELVIVVKDHWEQIKSFFAGIADWFNSTVLQPLVQFFQPVIDRIKQMWEGLMQVVSHVKDRFVEFWQSIVSGVQSWVANVKSYLQPMIDNFNELRDTFSEFVGFIGQKLQELWGKIVPILQSIGNLFKTVFTAIFNFVAPIMRAIGEVITTVLQAVWNFVSPIIQTIWNTVLNVFTAIFDTVMNVLQALWNGIVGVVNGIITIVMSIVSGIWNFISNILMGIMNLIMGHTEQAKQNFSEAWNAIKDTVTGVLSGIWQIISSVFTAIAGVITSILIGIWNVVVAIWNGILSTISAVLSGIANIVSNGLNAVRNTVSNVFNGIKNTISNVMSGAVNIVRGAVSKLKSAFNFHWSLPHLNLPHISVTGGVAPFGIGGKGSLPHFSVSWYKNGGVFEKPSVIGVGEAGAEAVMPLENNTEWIGLLANMISSEINQSRSQLTPSSTTYQTTEGNTTSQKYLTNNNQSTTTYGGDTDNSVVFNQGAIQIIAQNSSAEECKRMAEFIMQYIERKKQLNTMLAYNS